jgi:hypothetical protein
MAVIAEFTGWSPDEAMQRVLGLSDDHSRATELLSYLDSGHLVGYVRAPSDGELRRCTAAESRALLSQVVTREANPSQSPELVLFPVVCAPDAPSILNGWTLKEAIFSYVLKDPELLRVASHLGSRDGRTRRYVKESYYPGGVNGWQVTSATICAETSESRLEWLMALRILPSDPLERQANQLANHRFGFLMRLLWSNALEGIGDPVRSRDSNAILKTLWNHNGYYVDLDNGDLVQDDDSGERLSVKPRWRGVVLRTPLASDAAWQSQIGGSASSIPIASLSQPIDPEKICYSWLVGVMRKSPGRRPSSLSKAVLKEDARTKWPDLSIRAFDRSWTRAVQDSNAGAWSKSGAPPGKRSALRKPK